MTELFRNKWNLAKTSHKIIFFILLSFVVSSVLEAAIFQSQYAIEIIHSLITIVLLFIWCGRHAEENDVVPKSRARFQLLCASVGVVGVPFYLLIAFGFKKGGVKVLLGIATAVAIGACYFASYYLTQQAFNLFAS